MTGWPWAAKSRVYLICLVVSNMLIIFHFSYMGCHPSHWWTHIFHDGYKTTNQPLYTMVSLLNHHFPMVFPWFSYGFPMVIAPPTSNAIANASCSQLTAAGCEAGVGKPSSQRHRRKADCGGMFAWNGDTFACILGGSSHLVSGL